MAVFRGEIWWVEFEPSVGTEIKKTRPALVISNDISNEFYSKVTLIPMTSSRVKASSITVVVEPDTLNHLDRISTIRIPDITTFDKCRFRTKVGKLSPQQILEVEDKLRIHLGMV